MVWNRFEGRARNMIRKAEKNQVVAADEEVDTPVLDSFVDLVEATFKRQEWRPHIAIGLSNRWPGISRQ